MSRLRSLSNPENRPATGPGSSRASTEKRHSGLPSPAATWTGKADLGSQADAVLLTAVLGARDAGRVLRKFSSLRELAQAGDHEIGLHPRKTAALRAAIELGVRSVAELRHGDQLNSPTDVARFFAAHLAHEEVEVFIALALDVRNCVTKIVPIGRGCLTSVAVHPRDVFKPLIRHGAAAVIFVHNHPSGDPAPSQQDIELTTRLCEVGTLVGIQVLDHLVVGAGGRWVSVAEVG